MVSVGNVCGQVRIKIHRNSYVFLWTFFMGVLPILSATCHSFSLCNQMVGMSRTLCGEI